MLRGKRCDHISGLETLTKRDPNTRPPTMKLSSITSSILCLFTALVSSAHPPRSYSNKISQQDALAYVTKFFTFLKDPDAPGRNTTLAQELFTGDLNVFSQSRVSTRGGPVSPYSPRSETPLTSSSKQTFGPSATSLADFLANSSRPMVSLPPAVSDKAIPS